MIRPRPRLVFWTAALVLLAILAMLAGMPDLVLIALGVVLLIALADAVLGRRRAARVRITLPDLVRLAKDRPGSMMVQVMRDAAPVPWLELGVPFPREIVPEPEVLRVALPHADEPVRIPWRVTASQRGDYQFETVYFFMRSPIGLWDVRGERPAATAIRVYPDILRNRKQLAAIFLNRGTYGIHQQRALGQGREFEKLREYIPGDSFIDIHWKATAKRSRPVTKTYQIERTQEVYLIIDCSRLSAKEVMGEPVLEHFIRAALIMGRVVEQQNDHFGLMAFSDRMLSFIRARNGQAHYQTCRDALYTLQPRLVSPDFSSIISFIRARLRRRAMLLFLTDLSDPVLAETLCRDVEVICRQHLIMVNMLQPAHAAPLFMSGAVANTDDVYCHLGGHLVWHNLQEVGRSLQRRGVGLVQQRAEKLNPQLVSQYLSIKKRQLL